MNRSTPGTGRHEDAAASVVWYTACAAMFAALPAAYVLFRFHHTTAAYVAVGITGALECFFIGWFVGRASRV